MAIIGYTFENQLVKPKGDAGFYNHVLEDGILWGCGISTTAASVTVAKGMLVAGGRLIFFDGAHTEQIIEPQNGYMRMLLRIDLSAQATEDVFEQVTMRFDYQQTTQFPAPTRQAINDNGTVYEIEMGIFKVAGGSITEIVSTVPGAYRNADKLAGQFPAYYATKAQVDTAQATAEARANLKVSSVANANLVLTQPALSSTNCPGSGSWYILPISYGNTCVQIAFPYYNQPVGAEGVYYRLMGNSAWSIWRKLPSIEAADARYPQLDTSEFGTQNDAGNVLVQPKLCATGIPTSAYWYVLPISVIDHCTQLALPYWTLDTDTATSGLYYRTSQYTNGTRTWRAWKKLITSDMEFYSRHIWPKLTSAYDLGSSYMRWRNIYLNNSPNISCDSAGKELIANVEYDEGAPAQEENTPTLRTLAAKGANAGKQSIPIEDLRKLVEGLSIRTYRRYENEPATEDGGEGTVRVLSDKKELGIFIDDLKDHPLFEYIGQENTDDDGSKSYSLDLMSYTTLALALAKDAEARIRLLEEKETKLENLAALLAKKGVLTQAEIEEL